MTRRSSPMLDWICGNRWIQCLSMWSPAKPCIIMLPCAVISVSFPAASVTLMRLCLNLPGQDLAYRFSIHEPSVSLRFARALEVLFHKLKPLIVWPEEDTLLKTMPMLHHKHYTQCVVLIGCFEVSMDHCTSLLEWTKIYSSYVHHHTQRRRR